jgi:hypothetical protein
MNHPIVAAMLGLAESLKSPYYADGRTPKARTNGHQSSGMSRRGAIHKQSKSFKPRRISDLTPARYRHSHRGNPEKALYERMRLEKRKWISA